jgi:flagellar biogenesis protein FliO
MSNAVLVATLVKVVLVLVLLAVTLKVLGKVFGRTPGARSTRSRSAPPPIVIRHRAAVGRGASLVVARVGGRNRIFGVTEHSISDLGELTIDLTERDDPAPAPRRGVIESLRERTVRR